MNPPTKPNQKTGTSRLLTSIAADTAFLGLLIVWVIGLYNHHSISGIIIALTGFILLNALLLTSIHKLLHNTTKSWQRSAALTTGALYVIAVALPSALAIAMLLRSFFSAN